MKKITAALVAVAAVVSLSSCSKTPGDCTSALNAADNVLKATSRAATALSESDQTTFEDAISDMNVSGKIYRDLSAKCRAQA